MEPSTVNKILDKSDFNGLKLFPQEALICHLEDNERNKIFIWPREPFMGVSFLSYGIDLDEAKKNLGDMLDFIPRHLNMMRWMMQSFCDKKEPKEITFEEIRDGIEKDTMTIFLGETNTVMLRPAAFIEFLSEWLNIILLEGEPTNEMLLEEMRVFKDVLIGWLEYNKRFSWKKDKIDMDSL